MGKLKVFSSKTLCDLLKRHDFKIIRQKGSHIVLQRKLNDDTYTAIVPNHKEIKRGTLVSIIRQSGLDKKIFE
ncbi:MAG: type II toxin-antitoxin system HicA family toxin [Spirochaetia bacterium]|nr:type II toxin-antitoxin system HicA family toxin [Spirochaetia bacterium]